VAEVKKKTTYRVVFERDEAGFWVVTAPEFPGCHTQGKSLGSARTRIREALGLFVGDAATATLEEVVRLPGGRTDVMALAERLRREEEEARRGLAVVQRERAKLLRRLEEAGVGRRDSAELLGLTAAGVQHVIGQ
jgi:predicted RNase H-like HicB family nuclease